MKPTHSPLRRSVFLRRSGNRDFMVVRMAIISEVNVITTSTMKREIESLKSALGALHTSHLSTTEMRLPWTHQEKHRHEVNGHAE